MYMMLVMNRLSTIDAKKQFVMHQYDINKDT
jgi:hypothetical protein